LLAERCVSSGVSVRPQMEPNGVKIIGRIVGINYLHISMNSMGNIIQPSFDFIIKLLLKVVVLGLGG
jgi:hypothetical protein